MRENPPTRDPDWAKKPLAVDLNVQKAANRDLNVQIRRFSRVWTAS
jgi:hypothetical protein